MSYIRGDYYFWSDASDVTHFWSAEGYDAWDQSGWAVDEGGKKHEDRLNACGVGIPTMKMDEFVVMRLAQMIRAGLVEDAIDRSTESHSGNFGCEALIELAESLKENLHRVHVN
jgi:hypothetical protein